MTPPGPASEASTLAAPSEPDVRLLRQAYAAYNRQALDALLVLLSDDVTWPDGPRTLHGKAQVRAYWVEQLSRTRIRDQPVGMTRQDDGQFAVSIHQVVHALDGAVMSRGRFRHLHQLRAGRLTAMRLVRVGRAGRGAWAGAHRPARSTTTRTSQSGRRCPSCVVTCPGDACRCGWCPPPGGPRAPAWQSMRATLRRDDSPIKG